MDRYMVEEQVIDLAVELQRVARRRQRGWATISATKRAHVKRLTTFFTVLGLIISLVAPKTSLALNGDSHADVILQNETTGRIGVWLMNGTTLAQGTEVNETPYDGWKVVGVGDFNGDGHSDIVLQHQTTRRIGVWLMNGVKVATGTEVDATPYDGWKVVGIGSFNGDGHSDIVLQHQTTRRIGVWLMNGVKVAQGTEVDATPYDGWKVMAISGLPPASPTGLVAKRIEERTITLEWLDKSSNEWAFEVQRAPSGGSYTTVAIPISKTGTGSSMTYQDFNLSKNTEYCYRIRAYNDGGQAYSNTICARTLELLAPTNLVITNKTRTSLSLSWTDNAVNEYRYFVHEVDPSGRFLRKVAQIAANTGTGTMRYTVEGLAASTEYCFRVEAEIQSSINYALASSNVACGKTDAPPPPPPPDLTFNGSMWVVDAATGNTTYYPKAGRAFYVAWIVCNVGGSAAGAFDVQVQRDGAIEGYIPVSSLAAGACGTQYSNYPYGLPAGSHYWYVNLDWGNRVTESYESNNTNYLNIQVQP